MAIKVLYNIFILGTLKRKKIQHYRKETEKKKKEKMEVWEKKNKQTKKTSCSNFCHS